jgi:two-component system response regulator HydG
MDDTSRSRRVLVVDDDEDACRLLAAQLGRLNVGCDWRTTADAALAVLSEDRHDAVLTDLNLVGRSGIELAAAVRERVPGMPVILVTAFGTYANALAAMRSGVTDFLQKPITLDELARAVTAAVRRSAIRRLLVSLPRRLASTTYSSGMVGVSPSMRALYELIERASATDATVLVRGESGTGKELVARAVHDLSARHEGPFVAINCAAIPATILESELFGHERGAFTDAKAQRDGLLRRANGGTVFLDEIGDMPLGVQAKLLRALQEKSLRPVGSDLEIAFDARVVAATHRDLESAVAAGDFRGDLYYRLDVVRIDVPPLRERGEDVLLLAQHWLERSAFRHRKAVRGLSIAAAEKLLGHDWPGNVRELQNAIEHAVAISRYDLVLADDLPSRLSGTTEPAPQAGSEPLVPFEAVERDHILAVLRALSGNKAAAARVLGVDRRTLYRKLAEYEATARGKLAVVTHGDVVAATEVAGETSVVAPAAASAPAALSGPPVDAAPSDLEVDPRPLDDEEAVRAAP